MASKLNDVEIGAELYAHTVILDRLEKTDAIVHIHMRRFYDENTTRTLFTGIEAASRHHGG